MVECLIVLALFQVGLLHLSIVVVVEVVEEGELLLREVLLVEEAFLPVFCGVAMRGAVELTEFLGFSVVFLLFRLVLATNESDASFVVLALLPGLGLRRFAGLDELEGLLQFALLALAERVGHL